jgi:hypothetical protein
MAENNPIGAGAPEIREKYVWILAERLHFKLESLAVYDEPKIWGDLSERDRWVYRNLIEDLACYANVWRFLIKAPDDNLILNKIDIPK